MIQVRRLLVFVCFVGALSLAGCKSNSCCPNQCNEPNPPCNEPNPCNECNAVEACDPCGAPAAGR
jgi:hypothetical protein